MATLPGVVTVIVSATGYGLHVVIDHGGGLSSLYGHLDTVLVASGDLVTVGDVIGTVGSSGNATGPHLHFEIRRDGIAEDPRLDLALP
jgi:murein DD-endopeptidase MepM/ murein hydrolase activator NlpD